MYQLLLSLNNYIEFLKSDENRDDTYILPLLTIINDINIVIFENIDDEIKIKVTEYTKSQKIGFIYKRGNFYEPILYRKGDLSESYLLSLELDDSEHYQTIIVQYYKDNETRISMIDIFEKILNENGDKTTKLMIDNCSNVTHLVIKIIILLPNLYLFTKNINIYIVFG